MGRKRKAKFQKLPKYVYNNNGSVVYRPWVEGALHDQGWGAAQGFPGIRLERGGPRVEVHVLESNELAQHWDRLDEFEGEEYGRVPVEIHGLETGTVAGWIYALK